LKSFGMRSRKRRTGTIVRLALWRVG
jgi:hypothetical protein